jgi:hypothetical protein
VPNGPRGTVTRRIPVPVKKAAKERASKAKKSVAAKASKSTNRKTARKAGKAAPKKRGKKQISEIQKLTRRTCPSSTRTDGAT